MGTWPSRLAPQTGQVALIVEKRLLLTVRLFVSFYFSLTISLRISDSGGNSISVVVADLCPGCQGTNGIDLTEGAMAAMDWNYVAHGVDSVTYCL